MPVGGTAGRGDRFGGTAGFAGAAGFEGTAGFAGAADWGGTTGAPTLVSLPAPAGSACLLRYPSMKA